MGGKTVFHFLTPKIEQEQAGGWPLLTDTMVSAASVSSRSNDDLYRDAVQFDEGVVGQRLNYGRQLALKQLLEFPRTDVAGAHQHQLERPLMKQVRVVKVRVLGDHHPLLPGGELVDDLVGRLVLGGQLACVDDIMSRRLQQSCRGHAAGARPQENSCQNQVLASQLQGPLGKFQASQQVFAL
jgi:hypothetical protein